MVDTSNYLILKFEETKIHTLKNKNKTKPQNNNNNNNNKQT
jgi:hypothetical protein